MSPYPSSAGLFGTDAFVSDLSTGKRLQGEVDTRRRVRLFRIQRFDPCYEVMLRWDPRLPLLRLLVRRRACVGL